MIMLIESVLAVSLSTGSALNLHLRSEEGS